jgi:hypothetical protein
MVRKTALSRIALSIGIAQHIAVKPEVLSQSVLEDVMESLLAVMTEELGDREAYEWFEPIFLELLMDNKRRMFGNLEAATAQKAKTDTVQTLFLRIRDRWITLLKAKYKAFLLMKRTWQKRLARLWSKERASIVYVRPPARRPRNIQVRNRIGRRTQAKAALEPVQVPVSPKIAKHKPWKQLTKKQVLKAEVREKLQKLAEQQKQREEKLKSEKLAADARAKEQKLAEEKEGDDVVEIEKLVVADLKAKQLKVVEQKRLDEKAKIEKAEQQSKRDKIANALKAERVAKAAAALKLKQATKEQSKRDKAVPASRVEQTRMQQSKGDQGAAATQGKSVTESIVEQETTPEASDAKPKTEGSITVPNSLSVPQIRHKSYRQLALMGSEIAHNTPALLGRFEDAAPSSVSSIAIPAKERSETKGLTDKRTKVDTVKQTPDQTTACAELPLESVNAELSSTVMPQVEVTPTEFTSEADIDLLTQLPNVAPPVKVLDRLPLEEVAEQQPSETDIGIGSALAGKSISIDGAKSEGSSGIIAIAASQTSSVPLVEPILDQDTVCLTDDTTQTEALKPDNPESDKEKPAQTVSHQTSTGECVRSPSQALQTSIPQTSDEPAGAPVSPISAVAQGKKKELRTQKRRMLLEFRNPEAETLPLMTLNEYCGLSGYVIKTIAEEKSPGSWEGGVVIDGFGEELCTGSTRAAIVNEAARAFMRPGRLKPSGLAVKRARLEEFQGVQAIQG